MRFYLLCLLSFVLFFSSCKTPDYKKIFHNPGLYSQTVHELNSVVMGNNFTPVVASRNYAYANIAAYEVIAAGYPEKYNSLCGQLNGFKTVAKPLTGEKIDFEYASLLAFCRVGEAVTFPEGSMDYYIDSLHNMAVAHGMPGDILSGSEDYAKRVGLSVIKWSKGDHYLQTRSSSKYSVKDIPGRWVPTPPSYAAAVEPHWNEIRPMITHPISEYNVPPPPAFDVKNKDSKYYKEVMYIKNTSDSLNPEQIHIADFWDDNPGKLNVLGHVMFITKKFSPPGHWMSIVGIGAEKTKAGFGITVCAYAKTAIALYDAFVQCWTVKYIYNTARPETVINKYFDPEWRPHLQTPPFPEYTCGHCTISAAAAEALTSVLGDNVAYTDTSELEFGIKNRSYRSFRDAANENVWARFYGGIHFHNSCVVSNKYGKQIGELVVDRLRMKK